MQASRAHIKKIGRLGKQETYAKIRKSDMRWVSESFVVQAWPRIGSSSETYGLSITTSKKCAKLAVTRNRIRRRLKAAAQEILPVQASPNMNYMLTARPTAETKDYADLKKDLVWCLKRLNLLQQ